MSLADFPEVGCCVERLHCRGSGTSRSPSSGRGRSTCGGMRPDALRNRPALAGGHRGACRAREVEEVRAFGVVELERPGERIEDLV